jgi:hypothetical protein
VQIDLSFLPRTRATTGFDPPPTVLLRSHAAHIPVLRLLHLLRHRQVAVAAMVPASHPCRRRLRSAPSSCPSSCARAASSSGGGNCGACSSSQRLPPPMRERQVMAAAAVATPACPPSQRRAPHIFMEKN